MSRVPCGRLREGAPGLYIQITIHVTWHQVTRSLRGRRSKGKGKGMRGRDDAHLQSNQVKRTPQESINEFIIQKLNPLLVVDFRLISAFLYV